MITRNKSRKQIVPSGSQIISGKKDLVLEACLGTCLGVTLCDPDAYVGGLAHFILPEPTGALEDGHLERYASTGLPIFIKGLCDRGAEKERLTACMAGGALVGPLSERDLILDIGGRTTDIVVDLLKKEGIVISKRETGGFFTCCLGLDLSTFESSVEPLCEVPPKAVEGFKKPSPEEVDSAIDRVRPIPQIALKVIRMMRDDEQGLQEISRELRQDQVMSARVIRLSNSAYFGLKKRIDSVDQALVLIGGRNLLQLVLIASLHDFFTIDEKGYSLCKGGLFRHALGTAITSEMLAGSTGMALPAVGYTAGLLHDIGKAVLDQYVASAFPFFYRRTQQEGIELTEMERDLIGLSHTEVGNRLAKNWELPKNLEEAITYHHEPEKATVDVALTHLVYVADLIMSRFIVGQELERLNTDELASRLRKTGIEPEEFPAVVDSVSHKISEFPLSNGFT
ncbi:MAG: HDOD domain-containing protein [Thermodesulfobacteriota bacterium]|nr:HDOD domain-containing protein [Thermodesulfobacteriota bacterium]